MISKSISLKTFLCAAATVALIDIFLRKIIHCNFKTVLEFESNFEDSNLPDVLEVDKSQSLYVDLPLSEHIEVGIEPAHFG